MSKKIKVLFMGDSLTFPTGYSRQTKDLMKYLQNTGDYELLHFSWGYRGKPLKSFETLDGSWKFKDITMLPMGNKNFGQDRLALYINTYEPDIVIVVCDSFMLYPWVLNMTFNPAISFLWFPSDGGGFPRDCEKVVQKFDVPVAFTKYAQGQLSDLHNITTEQIWEAADPNIYHPLSNTHELKVKWSKRCKNCKGQHVDLTKRRILFCNSRNQGRKMLAEDVKCFSKVVHTKGFEDCVLLFNSDPNDAAAHTNLANVARLHKVDDCVLFTDMVNYIEGLSDSEVNELYNIGDIFVLLTSGEGFGLIYAEASMAGKCVVTTDYTNAREILPHGVFIPLDAELMGNWEVDRAIASISKGAEIIKDLLSKPEEIKKRGLLSREWAINNLAPHIIGKQWDDLIKSKLPQYQEVSA